jgi:hypothetical protein
MKKLKFVISFLGIFGLSFGVAHLLTSCKEKDILVVQGNIEGTVTDLETSQAISGVSVTIVANSNTTFAEQSKNTGSDGKFSFKDIEAGSYKLSFSKESYEDNSKNINLTAGQTSSGDVTLKPIKSAISVSPALLDFGMETTILPFEIRNTGKSELSWTITEDLNWLSVNPVSGKTSTEPTSVLVTVNRTLISESSKTGSLAITSNGGNAILNITVGKPVPVLGVTPTTLDFGSVETEKLLTVSNLGKETLTFEATAPQAWITLTDAKGSATTETKTIKVTVNRAGLSANNYSGEVAVNSNNNKITVSVSMSVVLPTAPDVLNGEASSITSAAAQVSGNISSPGSSAVTQHGHCWSTSSNPTTTDNKTTLGGTSIAKLFSSNITGLSASTNYYVRAYATNSTGTTYSNAITFTTLAPPTTATVRTLRTENVQQTSVDAVGELTVLGAALVTDYGFCYSSSKSSPTTADSKAALGSTSSLGEFRGTLTGLSESTKYFVRAYATNSVGTAYSDAVEVTTTDAPPAPPVVTGGLVAYYTFDNSTVDDITGNGWDGGAVNSPDYIDNTPSGAGKAVFLKKANNQKLTLPNPVQNANAYLWDYSATISLWVKDAGSGNVFCGEGGNANKVCPSLQIVNNDFMINSHNVCDGTSILQDGQWHNVAITFSGPNDVSLYIDGTIYGSKSVGVYAATSVIYINGALTYSGYTDANTFKVDNIRIYDRILSVTEIKTIYNAKQ